MYGQRVFFACAAKGELLDGNPVVAVPSFLMGFKADVADVGFARLMRLRSADWTFVLFQEILVFHLQVVVLSRVKGLMRIEHVCRIAGGKTQPARGLPDVL